MENVRIRDELGDTNPIQTGKATSWINESKSILITGRIVSVESSRAALSFAKCIGGVIDCSDSEVTMDVASAMSKTGGCSVSIAEVRDLSDVIIVLGDDGLLDRFPKLASSLAKRDRAPRIVLLGKQTSKSFEFWQQISAKVSAFDCDMERIPEALNSFFLLQNQSVSEDSFPDVGSSALFQELGEANYISLVWAPNSLGSYSTESKGRAAWIERLLEHQVEWNELRRVGSLALSGQDAVFQQVCLWTTGYPGRISFGKDSVEFDPAANSVRRWIAENRNAPDALLIEVDETAHQENDWLESQLVGFQGKRIRASLFHRPETKNELAFLHLPTQIAGFDRPADMLRADQTVLARVPEERSLSSTTARSLTQWLEALSQ
ncbi:MAG: hypothetical protein MUC43_02705 [Pirellula sp.]|nr:hypothetical protein [Pirellula sp.]